MVRRRKKSRPIFAFSRYRRSSAHNGVCPWKNSKMGATENAVAVVVVVFFYIFFFLIPFNSYGFFIIVVVLPSLHHARRPTRLATTSIIPVFGTHHTDDFSEFRTVDGDFFPYHSFPPQPPLPYFFFLFKRVFVAAADAPLHTTRRRLGARTLSSNY